MMTGYKDFEDKIKIEKEVSPQSKKAFETAYNKIRDTKAIKKPTSRKVFKIKYLAIAAGIVFIVGGIAWQTQTISKRDNVAQSKIVKTKPTKAFYYSKIKRVNSTSSIKSADYPQTFDKLFKQSDLLIKGKVVDLSAYQISNQAYTLATVEVSQNIKKPTQRVGQKIKILFIGGNFHDKKTGEKYVVKEEGHLLPKMDQELILALSKEPKGSNNLKFTYYMPIYTFYQNKNKEYQTEKLTDVYGGNEDGTQAKHKSDEQLNNEGISKKLNEYLRKNNLN